MGERGGECQIVGGNMDGRMGAGLGTGQLIGISGRERDVHLDEVPLAVRWTEEAKPNRSRRPLCTDWTG
jgi:hypothetical protein